MVTISNLVIIGSLAVVVALAGLLLATGNENAPGHKDRSDRT